ncbi:hypothetical protein RUND412_008145 [Rhizina undulata]
MVEYTVQELQAQESELQLVHFDANVAWEIGSIIRTLTQEHAKPVAISITHANSNQQLFFACSRPGTSPDNAYWVSRKQKTVLRFQCSTLQMREKCAAAGVTLGDRYYLSESEYGIHGGGFPIRVMGVEGVIGVIVVSGLSQEEDHQIIVDALRAYLAKNAGN